MKEVPTTEVIGLLSQWSAAGSPSRGHAVRYHLASLRKGRMGDSYGCPHVLVIVSPTAGTVGTIFQLPVIKFDEFVPRLNKLFADVAIRG